MKPIACAVLGLCLVTAAGPAHAEPDVFDRKRSDSGIKPFKFPKGMKVLQNRPAKGFYFFYNNGEPRFGQGLDAQPPAKDEFDDLLSDPELIRRTLIRTDPIRVAPASRGDVVRGPLTWETLEALGSRYSEAILFIFRREIRVTSPEPLPPAFFAHPRRLLEPGSGTTRTVEIQNRGILYLTQQEKVITLPSNKQVLSVPVEQGDARSRLQELARQGLEAIAAAAKQEINDRKFVKHRPTY